MKLTKAQESLRKSKEDAKKDKSRERSRSRERANRRANRERPLDREVALYAARADRGAKKGEARRKNYFQALVRICAQIANRRTTNLPLSDKDIPVGKPPPLKRADDPAYELQWM
ncbi:hypothetical protein NECAME_11079 [Necator americanus]|uniref:Uncharacterized protein n=1 Tax=Necator americanus TaxID=51031 RepID=W2T6Z6_NECAM|nr:hypothetical protein NECAME_11079 [Necator americanus]ETN77409.1 hypothetical protein NECAME_11079 [Necator americanus]